MGIVYKRYQQGSGLREYARRTDGEWFERHTSGTRTGMLKFGRWTKTSTETSLMLAVVVDPDNPPEQISLFGNPLELSRAAVRLPNGGSGKAERRTEGGVPGIRIWRR